MLEALSSALGCILRDARYRMAVLDSLLQEDVVLSLGIGIEPDFGFSSLPFFRNIFEDSFLHRLLRYLIYSFTGEKPWQELIRCVDEDSKAGYMRYNISLEHETSLDDISQIDTPKKIVHQTD